MNGTPRLRSAYPATPQNTGRRDGASGSASQLRSPLPDVNALKQQQQNSDGDSGPLIPFETIDAPQQRLYVVAFYVALLAWRLYDFHYLQEEETESLWLFMKWVAFDGIFLFGLPELRIPWLEWSSMTMTVLFIAHAILDGILMFRIPIPLGAGLVAISKIFYDRELAISERHVKHSDVVHNASLILGRTVVHILPEGSAILNPGLKKTGMYVLQKVIDESKLEVQRRRVSDTLIVQCPQAMVEPTDAHRCKGDLSNLELKVTGTPPLRLKYRKVVNQIEHEAHFQSIQPEDFVSPLSHQTSDALTLRGNVDISWARAQTVTVPLVKAWERVGSGPSPWKKLRTPSHDNQDRTRAKASHLHQVITVHERPVVQLNGCDPQHPLKVAKGMSAGIPVVKTSTGRGGFLDMPYEVEYLFTPEDKLLPNGDHSDSALRRQIVIKNAHSNPTVQHPGLYTLTRVKTEFCSGEVYEPASCLLQNPPEPSLRIDQEEIFDKCAKKAVGLRVDLHLTGTPPFNVQYKVTRVDHGRGDSKIAMKTIEGLRGQIELAPERAGHYTYEFTEISDAVYKGHALHGEGLVVEQDVKPSASAHIVHPSPKQVCIDEQVCYTVRFRGEGPFSLEYEVVRGNDRKRHEMRDIDKEETDICTDVLRKGGDYTLALASVTDRMGCKEFLKDDAKIHVRHQRPKASFGQVEGGRSIKTLEDKKVRLPVRLSGDAPWTITYRHKGHETQATMSRNNDGIEVQDEGTYEIMSVSDAVCPGAPDESTNKFEVKWVTRPQMRIAEGSYAEQVGKKYIKHEVCEGEEDSVDLHISVKYEERIKPDKGSNAMRVKTLNAALGSSSVRLDTTQPGVVEYKFTELGDYNYDHDVRQFSPLILQQRVNPRPTARFTNPGKTYSYCSVESAGEEVIPITLTGQPPFSVDFEIKHHGTARPEIISVSHIASTNHQLRIPHKSLHLGNSAVSIRKVQDSRGCGRVLDSSSPRVQISVHDAPTIAPLEHQDDFCVGDRISYALSGQAPFNVYYDFNGISRKAVSSSTPFRRLAEKPGTFTITGLTDSGSQCRANYNILRRIHGMPSVRVSKGRESYVDIHEGGEVEITFDFGGTPPFEFTWTRSTNARKGHKSQVLEMRSEVSEEYSMTIRASEEGTYEVVAIKDRYCAYTKAGVDFGKKGGKMLTY
ncbi:hypothetical protein H2203_007458 [Taxawa tesnikishii (nom. ined.)]|nr:hypothetical protein H2203_007458 [Dothideales sp. JES 119]